MNIVILIVTLLYIARLTILGFKKEYGFNHKIYLLLLLAMHFLMMGLAYYATENSPIVDAYNFYIRASEAQSWWSCFGPGSSFFIFLIYPLVQSGVSLFTLFLLSSAISYHAFLFYFHDFATSEVRGLGIFKISIVQWLFLLPSFHYWSGLFGKDSLVFFLLTVLLYRSKAGKLYAVNNLPILILIGAIRPHVFVVLMLVLGTVCLTSNQFSRKIKIRITTFFLASIVISVPILMRFLHIKDLNLGTVREKLAVFNTFGLNSGSGINYLESNFLERMWLLLFRPFFYDVKTSMQLIVSIENLIVLLSFLLFIFLFLRSKKKESVVWTEEIRFSLFLGLGIFLMISTYIYNLGLASRMRLMFVPFLLYAIHRCLPVTKEDS